MDIPGNRVKTVRRVIAPRAVKGVSVTRGAGYLLAIAICIPPGLFDAALSTNRAFLVPVATAIVVLAWLMVREARTYTPGKGAYLSIWVLLMGFLVWATIVSVAQPDTSDSMALVAAYASRFVMVYALVQLFVVDWMMIQRMWRLIAVLLVILILLSLANLNGFNDIYNTSAEGLSLQRISVGLGDPNFTALVFNLGIAGAFTWLMIARRSSHRFVAIVSIILLAIGVGRTVSIGGLIGLLVTLVLVVWKMVGTSGSRRMTALFVVAGLLIVIAGAAGAEYYARATQQVQRGEENVGSIGSERANLVIGGIRMALDNPIQGVGPANVPTEMPQYLLFPIFKPQQGPHNLLVALADETGLLSLLLLGGVVVYAFKILGRGLKFSVQTGFRDGYMVGRGLQIALIAILVQSFGVSTQRQPFFWLLVAFAIAYPVAQERLLKSSFLAMSRV